MEQNIIIKDKAISFILVDGVEYFNLTEIGTLDEESRDDLVRSWMRNRLTLESLIVWEQMFNPNFKGDALDTFRKEAGLNSFNLTILTNLESHNAELMRQGLSQVDRLEALEKVNTEQLSVLYEKRLNEVFKNKKIK